MKESIGIIGIGNMGSALLSGLIKSEKAFFQQFNIYDIDKEKLESFSKFSNVKIFKTIKELIQQSNYILLAVKPQVMGNLLEEIREYELKQKNIISIAAGLKIDFYKKILGKNAKITRVMPNTPYLVGEGAAGISFDEGIEEESRSLIQNIFEQDGKTIICDEQYLDVVTGLSGSGPAYIFMIIEALADGAVRMGLNRKDSYLLSAQTVLGAAKMVLETGKHPGELKDMVTSPGGTTIEALRTLEKHGIRSSLMEAVIAATEKSQGMKK